MVVVGRVELGGAGALQIQHLAQAHDEELRVGPFRPAGGRERRDEAVYRAGRAASVVHQIAPCKAKASMIGPWTRLTQSPVGTARGRPVGGGVGTCAPISWRSGPSGLRCSCRSPGVARLAPCAAARRPPEPARGLPPDQRTRRPSRHPEQGRHSSLPLPPVASADGPAGRSRAPRPPSPPVRDAGVAARRAARHPAPVPRPVRSGFRNRLSSTGAAACQPVDVGAVHRGSRSVDGRMPKCRRNARVKWAGSL